MTEFVFKMPDLGEGTVDAEIVAWHIKPGDAVTEDELMVEVMTDKAAVEVPAPVSGRVVSVHGTAGEKIAVGAPLAVFELAASGAAPIPTAAPPAAPEPAPRAHEPVAPTQSAAASSGARVKTSPANRRRAREAGIDLAAIAGSGPGGRIVRGDLPHTAAAAAGKEGGSEKAATSEIKVIGVRRAIAERMSEAKRNIPHFSYVEEVDVSALETLRVHLNESQHPPGTLSYLPFVIMALVNVLEDFPQCNVRYDAARGVLVRHRAVHVGIATQTPEGLKVPVVRNAQSLGLWQLAAEIKRLAERARSARASRDELTGSTITVTSLGKLGGIASTPIINSPEVAIIGLNKAEPRPVVRSGQVVVRRLMNLSSSFDHRFVDGYDAAALIQALKDRLEQPATIFIPKAPRP